MAKNLKKRQRQLAHRQAKRKLKRATVTKQKNVTLSERLQRAAKSPILHCCTTDDIFSQGIGTVLISRQLENEQVAFATFLLDVFCLGVKDVYSDIARPNEYHERVFETQFRAGGPIEMEPASARKLIEGAVDYAAGLGLKPHSDYGKAKLMFGNIDSSECMTEFEYGKDGKPMFISGPYDTEEKCLRILKTIEKYSGESGVGHILSLSSGIEDFDEFFDDDDFDDDFDENDER